MNLWQLIQAGGFVMWPLLFLSLACLAVALERLLAFLKAPSPERLVADANDENGVQLGAQRLALGLEKNLPLLSTTATLAPLLGLLGTVTGMIGTFNALAGARTQGSADQVLSGIGEALYATATGIFIAVVALVLYNLFTARLRRILAEIEAKASEKFAPEAS